MTSATDSIFSKILAAKVPLPWTRSPSVVRRSSVAELAGQPTPVTLQLATISGPHKKIAWHEHPRTPTPKYTKTSTRSFIQNRIFPRPIFVVDRTSWADAPTAGKHHRHSHRTERGVCWWHWLPSVDYHLTDSDAVYALGVPRGRCPQCRLLLRLSSWGTYSAHLDWKRGEAMPTYLHVLRRGLHLVERQKLQPISELSD